MNGSITFNIRKWGGRDTKPKPGMILKHADNEA